MERTTLIVLAHPERQSFCGACAEVECRGGAEATGDRVLWSDLIRAGLRNPPPNRAGATTEPQRSAKAGPSRYPVEGTGARRRRSPARGCGPPRRTRSVPPGTRMRLSLPALVVRHRPRCSRAGADPLSSSTDCCMTWADASDTGLFAGQAGALLRPRRAPARQKAGRTEKEGETRLLALAAGLTRCAIAGWTWPSRFSPMAFMATNEGAGKAALEARVADVLAAQAGD